ncbi:MAG TPA: hypothetical protein VF458_19680 [Ktedonobacteraceae bacterium]
MKKRLLAWSGLVVLLLLPLLAACGSELPRQNGSASTSQVAPPVSGELYVLDSYVRAGQTAGNRHIVALQLGSANTTARLKLPAGLTDLKHQWLYVASLASGGNTRISVFDTRSGATVRAFTVAGSYSTADQGEADSMLSGDGRWLALREQHAPAGVTSITLVDTQAGKLVKMIHLNGSFALDAVSPKGTMLYLLEYYEAGTSHYNVRGYDVLASKLLDGNIVDKNELDEKMNGNFQARWMSDDGDMAYTLYTNPVNNKAFIHILWLADATSGSPFPLTARCIDLPAGQSAALLNYYTLALSRDGQTLYAANAALGVVATVDLNLGSNAYQLWLIPGAKIAHFTADKSVRGGQEFQLYHGSVLSPDQHRLYVAGPHGIQVIDTSTLSLRGVYLQRQSFTGLAISSDGQTLYAVDPASGITLLNSTSGQVNSVIQGTVQAPWGVAWATE